MSAVTKPAAFVQLLHSCAGITLAGVYWLRFKPGIPRHSYRSSAGLPDSPDETSTLARFRGVARYVSCASREERSWTSPSASIGRIRTNPGVLTRCARTAAVATRLCHYASARGGRRS